MGELTRQKTFDALRGPPIVGCEGEILQEVPSTMDVARRRLLEGAPDGYVVLAEHQSAGRGRDGSWRCPPGAGALLSVALRPGLAASRQKLVTILGAVAAAEAVRRAGVPARIKWPNDIVAASAPEEGPLSVRKLGGVLCERVDRPDAPAAQVLGIGLNVNQKREQLPEGADLAPASMRTEAGRRFDRNKICRMLLQELNFWYHRLRMGQPERLLARWRRLSCLLERKVRVRVDGCVFGGKVLGIRSTGELIFRDRTGRRHLLSDRNTELLV